MNWWIMRDGTPIRIRDMTSSHRANPVAMLARGIRRRRLRAELMGRTGHPDAARWLEECMRFEGRARRTIAAMRREAGRRR